jgi:hypothetical protein
MKKSLIALALATVVTTAISAPLVYTLTIENNTPVISVTPPAPPAPPPVVVNNKSACFVLDANGKKLYRYNGTGTDIIKPAEVTACADKPFIIEYTDSRGMRLYVNHKEATEQDCLFLKVNNGILQTYFAGVYSPVLNELGETVGQTYTCD